MRSSQCPQQHDESTLIAQRLSASRDLLEVRRIHAQIRDTGYSSNRFIANHLVKMYGRCGSVEEAWAVFSKIQSRNDYSWNLMITAYAQNGLLQEARSLLDAMPHKSVVALNAMLTAYAQTDRIPEARLLFDGMLSKDVISWTAMVAAYAQDGQILQARKLFDLMPKRNLVSWNSMISGYAQLGHASEARNLFQRMPEKDLVSWTALISAYAKQERSEEALDTFRLMDLDGVVADTVAFAAVIDACCDLEAGKLLHAEIIVNSAEADLIVSTSLVAMYGRCFCLEEACHVFDKMLVKNTMSWNAMIVAHAQNGQGKSVIHLFRLMDLEGMHPNEFTFASVFDACSSAGALSDGKIIHRSVVDDDNQLCDLDVVVGTALINMYGKCGCLEDAKKLFNAILNKNVLCVTAMVAAYAQAGDSRKALEVFRVLGTEGVEPDRIAFISALSACSHAGLLDEGWSIFASMKQDYGIQPGLDHFLCMIDLLGRAGKLQESVDLINSMPFEPGAISWTSFLSGCATQGDITTTTRKSAAKEAVVLEPDNSGSYHLLLHA